MQPTQNVKHSERRGKVLIDRDLQLRFIGRLGGVLLFYLLLFLVISIVAPVAFTFLGDPPEWAVMETAFRVEVLLRLILAPLVCTFLCLFAHGVLETFKIAGPNYRFKAVFRSMQRLQLPRGVQTRKGDLLQDTAREFDEALVALHDQVRMLQEQAVVARQMVNAALADQDDASSREALAAVANVEQELSKFSLCTRAPACQPLPRPGEIPESAEAGVLGEPVEPLPEESSVNYER